MNKSKRFAELEAQGMVRLRVLPDEHASMEDLKGDCFNRKANPDIPEDRMAQEERDFEERVEREGVWGVVAEYFDGHRWQHADSCWGFVGNDWESEREEFETAAVEAYEAIKRCPTCNQAVAS